MTATTYTQQLNEKIQRIQTLFGDNIPEDFAVYASEEKHYRMRAEFRLWHENGHIDYAMFHIDENKKRQVIKLTQFDTASSAINNLMPLLKAEIEAQELLLNGSYQVNFLSTLSGEILVTLVYHKKLDEAWETAARAIAKHLNIKIIGRSKGQKIVLSEDFVTETLHINGRAFHYRQIEGAFTQPNAHICEKMIEWAVSVTGTQHNDLLELYCGNGNFTLPLSQHFRDVLVTEISKTSVEAALWNIKANQCQNIKIARLSAEELSLAFAKKRVFNRLIEQDIDLEAYDFGTVFVDPPRAGIDKDTLALLAQFPRIVYVSCNPDTLSQNLDSLLATHHIEKMALFDQFPFTSHIESGVLLVKNQ